MEFINERLIINKNYHFNEYNKIPVPRSLNEEDIKAAWGDIFDNIKQFKNGKTKLGKLKLISTKPSCYEGNTFTLYPDYDGKITITRTSRGGVSIWASEKTIKQVTDGISELLYKEGWRLK